MPSRPYCRQRLSPNYTQRPHEHPAQYYNPPVQVDVMEGADNQGAGEEGRPMRQNMYWEL